MGCWLETCGVSQLSIHANEPVRLFILEEVQTERDYSGGMSYCDALWRPRYLPLRGTYDEYGGIENVQLNLNTKIVVDDIARHLVEKESDIADRCVVRKHAISLSPVLHWLERGFLELKTGRLGHMLVLEDVYQALVQMGLGAENQYARLGPGWSSRSDECGNYYSALLNLGYEVEFDIFAEQRRRLENEPKPVPKDEAPEITELRRQTTEYHRFLYAFDELRKQFAPQSGKGSQSDNYEAHLVLCDAIATIAWNRKKHA